MNPHALSILQQRILTVFYSAKRDMEAADVCVELTIHGNRDLRRVQRSMAGLIQRGLLASSGYSTMHPARLTDTGRMVAATIRAARSAQPVNQPMWR